MNTERKGFRAEIKTAGADGSFEAVIATLNVIDSDGDIIVPGAFGDGVASVVPAHDHGSVPLGKAHIEERGGRAVAVGRFNLDIQKAKDWHSALKFDLANGDAVQEWSFAFRPIDAEDETRNGQRVRILKQMDVIEYSPVLRGAGLGTRTVAVKQLFSRDPRIARLQKDFYDECIAAGEPGEMPPEAEVKAFFAREKAAKADEGITIPASNPRSAPFQYVYCRADHYEVECTQRLATAVAGLLGIATPTVRFFRAARPGETADYGRSDDVGGFADHEEKAIYVRLRSERKWSLADVVAHECRHQWQAARGWDMYNKARIEDDAGAFGKQFASLPDYADLVLGEGGPPMKLDGAGRLFGTFYLDRKSGQMYQAIGEAPWPRWNYHDRLELQ